MKILNGGKKDYYDYLVGTYGIDEHVVYDRRNSVKIREFSQGEEYFLTRRLYDDKEKEFRSHYKVIDGKKKYVTELVGKKYHIVLEIGIKKYLFEIERYLENDAVKINPSLIKEICNTKKISKYPISIIPCVYYNGGFLSEMYGEIKYIIKQEIPNPILVNTFIPSFIDPNIVYTELYNYLLSIKDKDIIDNRTDVEKLESFGFDKKTSFRNPVYNANNKKNRKK